MATQISRTRKTAKRNGHNDNLVGLSIPYPVEPVNEIPAAQPSVIFSDTDPEDFDANIYIHSTADVSPTAQIGIGSRIWQHAQIRERVQLGQQCVVGKGVYIDRDVVIGSFVKIQNYSSIYRGVMVETGAFIGPHVIFGNDLHPRSITNTGRLKTETDWELECTLVGYGASIGGGSVILPGVRIGAFAVIAPGSVVTEDVPEQRFVVGNPARINGYVCRCGRILEPNPKATGWICNNCQETYFFNS